MGTLLKRLRGAIGTAVTWGIAWFFTSIPFTLMISVFVPPPIPRWQMAIVIGQSIAGLGFLSGGAFSLLLGTMGRHRRLEDLNPVRFAIGTAAAVGLLLPTFTIVTNVLGGFPVPVAPTAIATGVSTLLAGATALVTIRVAQQALVSGDDRDAVEGPTEVTLLSS